jgi:hypothetical protein
MCEHRISVEVETGGSLYAKTEGNRGTLRGCALDVGSCPFPGVGIPQPDTRESATHRVTAKSCACRTFGPSFVERNLREQRKD